MNEVAASVPDGRPPRALIVSDVLLFREGVRTGLSRIGSLDIAAAAAPAQAAAILAAEVIDVLILDASRPSALARAAELRAAWPHLKIIAFGICSYREMLAGAEFGICAFVDEDGGVADINQAALMAVQDESYCSPRATARLIGHIASLARNVTRAPGARLTHRELEVASMVGRGLSNKQIAQELSISPATVKNHVHNILEKSHLPSRSAIGVTHMQSRAVS